MTPTRLRSIAASLVALAVATLVAPSAALAHALNATYTSRLPLAVYLAGAASTLLVEES